MLKFLAPRTLLAAIAALTLATSIARADNIVSNGSFELYTGGYGGAPSAVSNTNGQGAGYTYLTGWNLAPTGYTFLFAPGSADTTGSWTPQFSGALEVFGPGNGSANGLTATSPDGGNFIIADPVFQESALYQTVSGLTPGQTYYVSFWYAGGQQTGFVGATTEGWQVSLGGQTLTTPILNNVNHGFTGWQRETMAFTADSASPVLSFFALGTPNGLPPMAFLDGVSISVNAPLPSPILLSVGGLLVLSTLAQVRKARKAKRAAVIA